MKKFIFSLSAALSMLLIYSCTKEGRKDYIDDSLPAPGQISNVRVLPFAGGAKIVYTLPSDPNLSYIKASYETQPGTVREAKSSLYTDTITVVGYGDTLIHQVKLYSVGKNERESAPVTVDVQPQTPAIHSVFRTLQLDSTFGGVTVRFNNPAAAELSIYVIVDTTGKGTWAPVTTFYTGAVQGKFSARGQKPLSRRFAVYAEDRWSNKSDTLQKSLTPLLEAEIAKPWVSMRLPTDQWEPVNSGYSVEKLWDNKYTVVQDGFASPNSAKIPQWFTIDFGRRVIINRFKKWQASSSHVYANSAVKRFELWGSNAPDANGSWDKWELLGTFEAYKPSGLPMGQLSAEDRQYSTVDGEDFEFEDVPPAIRYLRFKTLETYSNAGQVVLGELSFWGQEQR